MQHLGLVVLGAYCLASCVQISGDDKDKDPDKSSLDEICDNGIDDNDNAASDCADTACDAEAHCRIEIPTDNFLVPESVGSPYDRTVRCTTMRSGDIGRHMRWLELTYSKTESLGRAVISVNQFVDGLTYPVENTPNNEVVRFEAAQLRRALGDSLCVGLVTDQDQSAAPVQFSWSVLMGVE